MLGSIPHQKFCFYHLPTRGRAGIKLGDAWYVSNVSIIFDCSMLLYYFFWMLTGFILHFYIIFGTNLLTRGPTQIAVFLPISVFRRKGISNGVQTEWNLRESYFWNKRNLGDLEWTCRKQRGSHEAGRRAPCLVPSWLLSWRRVQVLWIAFVLKIMFPKVSFRLDSVWYSFSAKHWNRQKKAIWAGPPVNRLVPKIL